jgi:hypothetical protein
VAGIGRETFLSYLVASKILAPKEIAAPWSSPFVCAWRSIMICNDSFRRRLLLTALALALPIVPVAADQGGGRQSGPRYVLATETTIRGTVEAIEQVADPARGRGRLGLGGTHLTLKTSSETLEVHLGPTAFLTSQKLNVVKGDQLEIVGSRVTVDDDRFLIAKSVKKGERTWSLRDAAGLPLWRRGRGSLR